MKTGHLFLIHPDNEIWNVNLNQQTEFIKNISKALLFSLLEEKKMTLSEYERCLEEFEKKGEGKDMG